MHVDVSYFRDNSNFVFKPVKEVPEKISFYKHLSSMIELYNYHKKNPKKKTKKHEKLGEEHLFQIVRTTQNLTRFLEAVLLYIGKLAFNEHIRSSSC